MLHARGVSADLTIPERLDATSSRPIFDKIIRLLHSRRSLGMQRCSISNFVSDDALSRQVYTTRWQLTAARHRSNRRHTIGHEFLGRISVWPSSVLGQRALMNYERGGLQLVHTGYID